MFFKQNSTPVVTIILAAGGTPVTGLTFSDVNCYVAKNGAAPGAFTLTVGNFAEVSAVNMPGLYRVTFDAASTNTLGEWVALFSDPLALGTFDQYAARAYIQTYLFDEVHARVVAAESLLDAAITATETTLDTSISTSEGVVTGAITATEATLDGAITAAQVALTAEVDANESKIDVININIGGFLTAIDEVKGVGFISATHSLKAQSDLFNARVPGDLALKAHLVGAGGTENAPAGVGIWDVLGDGTISLGDIDVSLRRILGLVHENFSVTNQTYDPVNNLISATVKTYPTAPDVLAGTNAIAEYAISATYDVSNRLTNYSMTKV